MQSAASQRQLEVIPVQAQSEDELGTALDAASQAGAEAMIVIATPLFFDTSTQLSQLTIKHRLPTLYESSATAGQSGLIWYGQNLSDDFRRAGVYAGRLLDGARPSDLPWLPPERFDFGINLDTARAVGLRVPSAILAQATQVIGQPQAPLMPAPAQVPRRT
jgi:putative ABC transport system substrate-binding protein